MWRLVSAKQVVTVVVLMAAARVLWSGYTYFEYGRQRYRLEAAWMILVVLTSVCAWYSNRHHSDGMEHFSLDPDVHFSARSIFAAFLLSSFALYYPALSLGLLSDDFVLLNRTGIEILDLNAWELYRPLPLLLWKGLFAIGGVAALHLLNVALHGINAWLMMRLTLLLGHSWPISIIAGLIFLTFPAAVEPVAWNSGIFDVAMTCFGLLYLHAAQYATIVWPLLFLVAALLAKETAVALPLILCVLGFRHKPCLRVIIASSGVTILYLLVRLAAGLDLPRGEAASLRYTIKEVIVRPFALLGAPWTQDELAEHPLMLGMSVLTLVVILVVRSALRPTLGTRPLAGAVIVVLAVLPLWHIVFIGSGLEGSRYVYLPLVGWCLLLADLAGRARYPRHFVVCMALTFFVVTGAWGVRQHLSTWKHAAALRDIVLESALSQLVQHDCASGHFRGAPDSFKGAYVFQNGLPEAVASTTPVLRGGSTCEFEWRDSRFVRIK